MKVPEFSLRRVLLAIGIAVGLCAAGFGIFVLRFVPLAFEPGFPPPAGRVEARAQDLQVLDLWARKDWSVTELLRRRIRAARSGARESAQHPVYSMPDYRFELWVARTLALADNAHTNVSPEARRGRLNGVPLNYFLFADGLYILEAREDHGDLLGARVMAIDGRPVSELVDALAPFHGGPPSFNRAHAALNLASPELLYAAGLTSRPEAYELTVRHNGRESRVAIVAEPAEQLTPRGLSQVAALRRTTPDGWDHLLANRPPMLLEHVDSRLGPGLLLTCWGRGLYVRIDAHRDSAVSLSEFKRRVVQRVKEQNPGFFVLDLRWNRGGTWSTGFSKRTVGALADDANVYILISEHTFSAGIIEAALFKEAAEGRAIIVGDGPGDRLRFWANGGTALTTPNSGIDLRIWTGYEDWADGCSDWKRCFWITMFSGVAVGDLSPDLVAPLAFANYAAGEDSALKAVADAKNEAAAAGRGQVVNSANDCRAETNWR